MIGDFALEERFRIQGMVAWVQQNRGWHDIP